MLQASSLTSPPNRRGTGSVFALIIGIDEYFQVRPVLQGAVNDARAFENYLLDEQGLQVPSKNICFLENANATREAILSAFKSHLLENPNIPDDGEAAMILFFAGHGSRPDAPENSSSPYRKVEVICPVDEGTTDAAKQYVHAIPDYVLAWLLSDLAKKKGSNITVILDCCHSGGMGRKSTHQTARAAISVSSSIPLELDSHLAPSISRGPDTQLWDGRPTMQPYRLWSPSATSHVLLAACREDETAWEIETSDGSIRGRFTAELIRCLRRADLKGATYKELMHQMEKFEGQTPHCGGTKSDTQIFSQNYPTTSPHSVLLTPQTQPNPDVPNSKSSEQFWVPMGSIYGVVKGTKFSASSPDGDFLGTFVAVDVETDKTILVGEMEPPVNIPSGSRAVVSAWENDMMVQRIYTDGHFPYTAELFRGPRIGPPRRFVKTDSPERADIIVRSEKEENQEILVKTCTPTMRKCRPPEMRLVLSPTLPDAMNAIAHFTSCLELTQTKNTHRINGFRLEMYLLGGDFPELKPLDLNANMINAGEVKFTSKEDAMYGFRMCNTSGLDLFPYLFYFDPEHHTVEQWYLPPDENVKAPLPNDRDMTVGMGSETGFRFTLDDDQVSSSGFIKLFVTPKYANFEWMEQKQPPFSAKFTPGVERIGIGRGPKLEVRWDALTVMMTLTRGKSE